MLDNWRVLGLVSVLSTLATAAMACSGGPLDASTSSMATSGVGGAGGAGGKGPESTGVGFGGSAAGLQSLSLDPKAATIECLNGVAAKQTFKVIGHYADGSSSPVAGASWTAGSPNVGSIDATGTFAASGATGGVVKIKVSYQSQEATADLTVKVHLTQNSSGAPPNVEAALTAANAQDPSVVWAYPYDGTVWPRGLLAPILQWNGGAAADLYFLHLESPTFELEAVTSATKAPSSRVAIDETTWRSYVDSTSGKTQVTVARWDGTSATLLAKQTWSVAPASMRGTIYYWSNNRGRVLRIKPGAAMADDFANQPPLNDPAQYTQSGCLMTCHTVSADGSTLVSGGGVFGGSYDLKKDQPVYSLGGTWGAGQNSASVIAWMMPALSPDGKYLLTNAMADRLARATDGSAGARDLFTTADGKVVANSGVQGLSLAQPTWSPEGSRVAFVDAGDSATWAHWNNPPPGDLKLYSFDASKNPMFFGETTLVATGADPLQRIAWPTLSPDGNWVVYTRTAGADTRTGNADLFIASTTQANQETRLAQVNGDNYPFAAGARDLSWNFEPSFAPVAAGGYFWVVFTSRRTYGNVLTGEKKLVKQLWVTAIDENPQPGKDPSHPAFHLTGQDEGNLAMRGFWALDPCKGDGQGCASGTECCGGYCEMGSGDAGGFVCGSSQGGCSQDGDKCAVAADCCGASQGSQCINHVCAEAPPK